MFSQSPLFAEKLEDVLRSCGEQREEEEEEEGGRRRRPRLQTTGFGAEREAAVCVGLGAPTRNDEGFDDTYNKAVDICKSNLKFKVETVKQKSLYYHHRTRIGTPSVSRHSLTEEDLERFERENDGFPIPSTEQELKAFDDWFFALRKESNYTHHLVLRTKQQKKLTPAKPKFLERLITGVGSKLGKSHSHHNTNQKINGIILPENTHDEGCIDDSKDSQVEGSCFCSSIETSSSPPNRFWGNDLETPTSPVISNAWRTSNSTPSSPKLSGIVKQRCSDFQKLCEEKKISPKGTWDITSKHERKLSKSMPSSPQCRSKHISETIHKLTTSSLSPVERRRKNHLCIKNEYIPNATMSSGYVKALANKFNQNNRTSDSDASVNSLEAGSPSRFLVTSEKYGSPRLQKASKSDDTLGSKTKENVCVLDAKKGYINRNGVVSLAVSKAELDAKANGSRFNCREKTSNSDNGINSLSPEELFDSSWSESDTFDDYSSNESDLEDKVISSVHHHEVSSEVPKDKLYKIAEELLKTERAYVTKLHLVDQVFHFKVMVENQAHNFLPTEVIPQMFSNIKSIYQFHHDFLWPQLEERMKNWHTAQRIGDLMRRNAPFLKLYSEYVKNFDHAMNLINQWSEKSPKFAAIVQEIQQDPDCASLSLQHHMLEPIQRVPRYELLLRDYLKNLPEDSPDREDTKVALQKVTEAASHSNEAMTKIDKFRKLLEVHQSLGGTIDLISPTRQLVKEGRIIKISARSGEKQERYLFLFNDLFLICSEPLLGTYKIRASLDLDGMEVKHGSNLDIPNAFYVRSKQKTIELLNDGSLEDASSWYNLIGGVIDDFNCKKQSMRVEQAHHLPNPDDDELGKRAPTWIKDDAVTMCMQCGCHFTTFRRRHHCRACGIVVCGKCSSKKAPLFYDDLKYNRVCDKCYQVLGSATPTVKEVSENVPHKKGILQIKASDPSIICGYLHVSSDNCRSWCRRWFALHDNFVMYSFKAHEDVCALTSMPLPGYSVVIADEEDNMDRVNVFKLHHNNKQVQYFQTENEMLLNRWVQILTKIVVLELPEDLPEVSSKSGDETKKT